MDDQRWAQKLGSKKVFFDGPQLSQFSTQSFEIDTYYIVVIHLSETTVKLDYCAGGRSPPALKVREFSKFHLVFDKLSKAFQTAAIFLSSRYVKLERIALLQNPHSLKSDNQKLRYIGFNFQISALCAQRHPICHFISYRLKVVILFGQIKFMKRLQFAF